MLVLPIALPGIVTAIALNSSFNTFGISLGLLTIMIGHATFCIVVVYNNVIARLRRTPTSLVEASQDLGADGWQTFRYVTFPAIKTALIAGALLAFALSFDEIVVTNFVAGTQLTVPKFIYDNLRQPRNRPIVNVVAVIAMLVMIVPVYHRAATGGWGAGHRPPEAPQTPLRRPKRSTPRCPRGTGRPLRGGPSSDGGSWPPGRPRRRSSSNCALAAACCANIAAWIPWNRPSSQPTSWAWAIRISDSLGTVVDRRGERGELLLEIRRGSTAQFLDRALIHVRQPLASRLVQRRLPGLLEQLADHARDPEQLRRLGDRSPAAPRRARPPRGRPA